MTAEIVSLSKFRKAKERADKERQAEENRIKFGRTKGERIEQADEAARRDRLLDDSRIDKGDNGRGEGGRDGGNGGNGGNLDPGTVS